MSQRDHFWVIIRHTVSRSLENQLPQLPSDQLIRLFDELPDVYFIVKDLEGKFIHANDAVLRLFKIKDRSKIIGTTDYDRYPEVLADRWARDDQNVMKTGQSQVNKIELLFEGQGHVTWHSTSKYPLYADSNSITGVIILLRTHDGSSNYSKSFTDVTRFAQTIKDCESKTITVSELAKRCEVTERKLNRRFRDAMKMSAQEFILRHRIKGAAEELQNTDTPIISIALDYGFCDQSAFSKQFTKRMGLSPAKYRRRYSEK